MSRHSTQDEVPAVTPYDKKKMCSLCNVEVSRIAVYIINAAFPGISVLNVFVQQ